MVVCIVLSALGLILAALYCLGKKYFDLAQSLESIIVSFREGGMAHDVPMSEIQDTIIAGDRESSGIETILGKLVEVQNTQLRTKEEDREKEYNTLGVLQSSLQEAFVVPKSSFKEAFIILAEKFEGMTQEMAKARGRQLIPLSLYDGINMAFEDWVEGIKAILRCNDWNHTQLMEALPTSLTGQAKRSFDALKVEEKSTSEVLFKSLREKIAPESKKINKELFVKAKRETGESMVSFMDRCKMYIRRSEGDPNELFVKEFLKTKVLENLSPINRKILTAIMNTTDDLDSLVKSADSMTNSQTEPRSEIRDRFTRCGPVLEEVEIETLDEREPNQSHQNVLGYADKTERGQTGFHGYCGKCHQYGHSRRFCPMRMLN